MKSTIEHQLIPSKTRLTRWIVLILGGLFAFIGYFYLTTIQEPRVSFKTAPIDRGTIAKLVTATGTLEPILTVEVGSEVSGTILSLQADFNSIVRAGDVIANIDPEPFQAQLEQEQASLLSAKARLAQARAELALTKRDLVRANSLLNQGFIAQADLDVAQTEYQSSMAQVNLNLALVNQATAAVNAAQFNLNHTVIYSPVDGTVIDRKINAGQTVAASFQTPSLFTIAEDLTRMRVIAHVGEADIAEVARTQDVTFRVDAYPEMKFSGQVEQVRIASKEEDAVVTYDVAVSVDNSRLLLRPGMTADVAITVQLVSDILMIPNGALRFSPPEKSFAKVETHDQAIAGIDNTKLRVANENSSLSAYSAAWILDENGMPEKVLLDIGLTDDSFSEITSDSLNQGDLVIIGIDLETKGNKRNKLPPWFR